MPGTLRGADPVATMISFVAASACLPPSCSVTSTPTAAGEARGALDPVDLVFLEEHLDAAGQAGDHLVLARVHGGHVDRHGGAVDAGQPPFLRRLRDLQRVRVLEQCLGGNAAPDQAGAAERLLLLDHRDLEAQLRGANGGDIPAGPRANHYDVVLVSHNLSLWLTAFELSQGHEGLPSVRAARGAERVHLRLQLAVIELELPVHLGDLRQLPRRAPARCDQRRRTAISSADDRCTIQPCSVIELYTACRMSARRKTVLVIDAHDEARERLAQTLRRDYRVIRAASAEAGLALMDREDVDVLVADVQQPASAASTCCRSSARTSRSSRSS